ncbi:DNA/RNA-binding protein AlbA [Candidatus Nitrosopumilus sediminis]|uniref:DNA/RNA-binding protein Alba n=2 Tax=Nitrosopumilus TaxID=338191 RepID=K0BAC3_9ARCH|nr:DNA/RNA-binding protein AlbA [Candidatus Nitrosopumilus sediminis]
MIFSLLLPDSKTFEIFSKFDPNYLFLVNNGSNFSNIFNFVRKYPFSFKLSLNTKIYMSNETRDTVFIGKKPLMAYVTSTLIQLANLPSVNIKARGLSIGRAVDVAQIIARKTENAGYSIGEIKIGSESLESQDGRTRNVSTIEIEVKRNTN